VTEPNTVDVAFKAGPLQLLSTIAVQVATGVGLALVPGLILGTSSVARDLGGPSAPMVVLGTIGAILILASWVASSVAGKPKGRALLFLGGVLLVLLVLQISSWADQVYGTVDVFSGLFGWRTGAAVVATLASAAGAAGWFALRQRPARSYIALPVALLASIAALSPNIQFAWVICAIVPAIIAWVGWLISRVKTGGRLVDVATGNASTYPESAPYNPSVARSLGGSATSHLYQAAVSGQRTNIPALLSLIFGLLGFGIVPIVLGHIARSQIRRTGETGGGMALAGLILGYIVVGLGIAYIVVWVVILGILHTSTLGGN
jgi:hypothetical protein